MRSSVVALLAPAIVGLSFAAMALGCDQLNKPMSHPSSGSSSSSSSSGGPAGDAGESDAGAPLPAISAQPGDVHL